MSHPAAVAATIACFAFGFTPLALADHGGGPSSPAALGPGAHAGSVEPGGEDWYEIAQPPGEGVVVVVRFLESRSVYVALLAPDGRVLADDGGNTTLRGGDASGRVHLRIASHISETESAPYEVDVSSAPMPDLRARILAVRSTPLATQLGDLPVFWSHELDVRVENVGTAAGAAGLTLSASGAGTSDLPENFAWSLVTLAPGVASTRSFSWNSTGTLGDIDLRASLYPRPDLGDSDHSNNEDVEQYASVVGGAGVGILPMDGWIHCRFSLNDGVCTWMEARAEGFDTVVTAREGNVLVVVDARVRTDGVALDACTDALAGHCEDRWGRWSTDDRN